MIVLSADTSTPVNTVALMDDDHLLVETVVHCGRKHAERLLETVDWVLDEGGLALKDVQLLAVSHGPGSFTGLRVGISAWKGLALALSLPLVGVSTLDAIARLACAAQGTVCVLLDAKMKEVYGAVYEVRDGAVIKRAEDRVAPVHDLLSGLPQGTYFIGDGALLYLDDIRTSVPGALLAPAYLGVPRASTVAAEALSQWAAGVSGDAGAVNPVYLRKSQPEELRDKAAVP